MKVSGAGRDWVRKEYDPEYTASRDKSPKRAYLDRVTHMSDRCHTSLRFVWMLPEEEAIRSLLDGGFANDVCLDQRGEEAPCRGVLNVYYNKGSAQTQRYLMCGGVPHKQRHKMHWLRGSVFEGHVKLNANDVAGVLHCFGTSKGVDPTSSDTGLGRDTIGLLFDRLRMAASLVAQHHRDSVVFESCQVEADETVIRKERVYMATSNGRVRVGTIHHSVIALTQRGSTRMVVYMSEPRFVPVSDSGKPSPPPLPTIALIQPLLSKHLGKFVILHTDGAEAYAAVCKSLQAEGLQVVHDSVVHSQGQYTAFGRHDVSHDPEWEHCDFALLNDRGERRVRVIKGTQKCEGLWRHLKHGSAGVPMSVGNDDERLDLYCQTLVWRMQTCGCPYREVLRMCRAFRSLPTAQKTIVCSYGLRNADTRVKITFKPPVTYCKWYHISILYACGNTNSRRV